MKTYVKEDTAVVVLVLEEDGLHVLMFDVVNEAGAAASSGSLALTPTCSETTHESCARCGGGQPDDLDGRHDAIVTATR